MAKPNMEPKPVRVSITDIRIMIAVGICVLTSTLLNHFGIKLSYGEMKLEIIQKITAAISCLLVTQDGMGGQQGCRHSANKGYCHGRYCRSCNCSDRHSNWQRVGFGAASNGGPGAHISALQGSKSSIYELQNRWSKFHNYVVHSYCKRKARIYWYAYCIHNLWCAGGIAGNMDF